MTRPELTELTPAQIAPLEARIARLPDAWQDFARSHYLTLMGRTPGCSEAQLDEHAVLAVDLALGVGHDLGGTQPYIPVGSLFVAGEKAMRIVTAWRGGKTWADIAAAESITERRVRQIVSAWQREVFARAQAVLPLDA